MTSDSLRHGLFPAVPTPMHQDGSIDWESLERYAAWMAATPATGVAVWAHTGRGLHLAADDRMRILEIWRKTLPNKPVICGAGSSADVPDDATYFEQARQMAAQAKAGGASALLCYAPLRFRERDQEELDAKIIEYHTVLASVGLPLILFYLYEGAGGIRYSPSVLRSLLEMQAVIGIKVATLDSVMTFQDIARIVRDEFSHKVLVTGEDRFLGYSLMCGAEAALIGMGAAYVDLQHQLLEAFRRGDAEKFVGLNTLVDRLAQVTFVKPMEGYIGRMLYILARQGIIAQGSYRDPWGPSLQPSELRAIESVMQELTPWADR